MKVLIATNYSLDELERESSAGVWPRHHLWGLDALRGAGHEVVLLQHSDRPRLRNVSQALRFQLGDLSRQLSVLLSVRRNAIDVVVLAEMGSMRGLGLLRRMKLLRTPLVGVLHPSTPRSHLSRGSVDGFDCVLCLSTQIRLELSAISTRSVEVVTWGPDLEFVRRTTTDGTYVLSNGRTNRDHGVVARACAAAGVPLRINGSNVVGGALPTEQRSRRASEELVRDVEGAAVIAVGLARTDGTFGLTEINDALLFGKPVLMTRNAYIDVDIEDIGCGYWLEPGDERAWIARLAELMANPALRQEMGARARKYAERSWNYGQFTAGLLRAVDAASGGGSQPSNRRTRA